jgi:molybdopterin-guanine dinucleotide biosynthesis protein A
MELHFARGVRKVTAALAGVPTVCLSVPELAPFQNVNTPEDWAGYATG